MKVSILVRGLETDDKELLEKMMNAIDVQDWDTIDVTVTNLDKISIINVGLAMGEVCGRMVAKNTKKLFVLPTLKQLRPHKQNNQYRKAAWSKLQEVKAFLEGKGANTDNSWQHATVYLPGQKKIIIYETVEPPNVEGDIFISKRDSELLLRVKEAFKADAVLIREE